MTIPKPIRITALFIYILFIFYLAFRNAYLTSLYNLPKWLIPAIFLASILYICYEYIKLKMKEDKLESEIISIVNHTFRTPITSIIWHTKELEKNIPQNEKLLYIQNINNSTSKLLNTIDILVGIKNIKNTSGYSFQATSIREIVEKSIKKHRDQINKKGITFQIPTFKDIPLLTVDLKKISFVVDTIIENATFYANQNGRIIVDCVSNPKRIVLYISDTGIGLSMIDKMMLFSKFYRGRRAKLMNTDGMGLRLYLSKQIIKRHNGRIYAKSNGRGEGTTFFIELPFSR